MNFSERDWRLLRSVHRTALERYCTEVLEESAMVIRGAGSPHERYLRLFRLLKERDNSIAAAFNDLRRATAIHRLAAMISLGVVTDEELNKFSESARESATGLAEIWRASSKRNK
jgi:hypothetical protein